MTVVVFGIEEAQDFGSCAPCIFLGGAFRVFCIAGLDCIHHFPEISDAFD